MQGGKRRLSGSKSSFANVAMDNMASNPKDAKMVDLSGPDPSPFYLAQSHTILLIPCGLLAALRV